MDSLLTSVAVLLFALICLAAVAYLPLQLVAILRLRGGLRLASTLPMPIMFVTIPWTILDWFENSDLWPIPFLFSGIPATYYLLVLLLAHKLTPPIYRTARPGHCPTCNYDCRGIGTDRCPECGGPLRARTHAAPPDAT